MVKIKRSPKPEKYNIHSDEFFRTLRKDFHNKCYICEQKGFKDAEKEHLIPQSEDESLKRDWDNIFFACSTCNNIKGTVKIIDCTKIDPEEYIELRYKSNDSYNESILVNIRDRGKDTKFLTETIEILTKVYNSNEPAGREHASNTLRSYVNAELVEFEKRLKPYIDIDDEETDEAIKKRFLERIKQLLQIDTQFAAFKRQIIRDSKNPKLLNLKKCLELGAEA